MHVSHTSHSHSSEKQGYVNNLKFPVALTLPADSLIDPACLCGVWTCSSCACVAFLGALRFPPEYKDILARRSV